MAWFRAIVAELWSLFVDDSGLALAALAWAGLIWLLVRAGRMGPFAGPLLFAGFAVILAASVVRRASRKP